MWGTLASAVSSAKTAYTVYKISKEKVPVVYQQFKDATKLRELKKEADSTYTGNTYVSLHPVPSTTIHDIEWTLFLPTDIRVRTDRITRTDCVQHTHRSHTNEHKNHHTNKHRRNHVVHETVSQGHASAQRGADDTLSDTKL